MMFILNTRKCNKQLYPTKIPLHLFLFLKKKHPGIQAIWDMYHPNHYCPAAKTVILEDIPGSPVLSAASPDSF